MITPSRPAKIVVATGRTNCRLSPGQANPVPPQIYPIRLRVSPWLWFRSESEYWLTSLPGQAAIDRRQLFLPVDDAHSGRLWAWDIVPNWRGGHPTRSVCRVAHAHPGASRPQRNNLSRLWPVQIRDYSPLTFSKPRIRNWQKPRPCLICPKTGSTVSMRNA